MVQTETQLAWVSRSEHKNQIKLNLNFPHKTNKSQYSYCQSITLCCTDGIITDRIDLFGGRRMSLEIRFIYL